MADTIQMLSELIVMTAKFNSGMRAAQNFIISSGITSDDWLFQGFGYDVSKYILQKI